eukprot:m51a1_g13808 putative u2 small nuclear ribonucleoprotein b -like (254) ;mRNA; f:395297-396453
MEVDSAPGAPGTEPVAAAAAGSSDVPPCPTVYVNNLNEKIKKEELKKALYAVFSQYGRILDVVAMSTFKMRGQAFVVFSEVSEAAAAIRAMQNFSFFDKPMRVTYARSKSDAIAKQEGALKDEREVKERRAAKRKAEAAQLRKSAKKQDTGKGKSSKPSSTGAGAGAAASGAPAAPNKMLFIESLPAAATEAALKSVLAQFPGFKEAKLVPSKQGLAFAEFENELNAGVAMAALQGYRGFGEDASISITYAKR